MEYINPQETRTETFMDKNWKTSFGIECISRIRISYSWYSHIGIHHTLLNTEGHMREKHWGLSNEGLVVLGFISLESASCKRKGEVEIRQKIMRYFCRKSYFPAIMSMFNQIKVSPETIWHEISTSWSFSPYLSVLYPNSSVECHCTSENSDESIIFRAFQSYLCWKWLSNYYFHYDAESIKMTQSQHSTVITDFLESFDMIFYFFNINLS